MANPPAGVPGRLISHFTSRAREQQSQGWSELWDSDESSLWDRGQPSKALIDFVESRPDVLRRPHHDGIRLRALVPGCGKGYDVVMLALHGFDVYGLEVSEKGAQVARKYARSELSDPSAINYRSEDEWERTPAGGIQIIAGDFFSRDWEASCTVDEATRFDLIYDYTFLCALLPEMRKDWARRMSELLAPGGILVCLEFPLYKNLTEQGPPWGLKGVHWNLLAEGGDGRISEPRDEAEAEASSGKFKRLLYFQPPRSYESGKGTDMVSVWALKDAVPSSCVA